MAPTASVSTSAASVSTSAASVSASPHPAALPSWRSRLLWLAMIWAASVAALGAAAYALRLVMRAIGMSA